MRVVLHGRGDALEFRLVGNGWLDEKGQRVAIEAILGPPHQGGRQTNTKNTTTTETMKTASAAARSGAAIN